MKKPKNYKEDSFKVKQCNRLNIEFLTRQQFCMDISDFGIREKSTKEMSSNNVRYSTGG